jgi:short-subunit dehydrogenase
VHPIGTKTEFFETGGKITRRMAATDGAMSTPAFFTQPPQRVARAVVRCLQRPKPEVWTSFATRVLTSVIALFPRVMDAARWVR